MKKYALIIGNNQYDDPAWNDLKMPELDAQAMAAVLGDPKIGDFEVNTLRNAAVPQMREAIFKLFDKDSHQPDDMLLLYFSGHGRYEANQQFYFVGKDTWNDSRVRYSGLSASSVNELMQAARATRQVIILDCCHSGAFGEVAKGSVPTEAIFNGTGRHILTASEALHLAYEQDKVSGTFKNSFFTHFLVEGLKTGQADRNHDGYIDVDELFEHIRVGMADNSHGQRPRKYSPEAHGDLIIARSPISRFERAREQLTDLLVQAENAAERGDYARAEELLERVITTEPDGLLAESANHLLTELQAERERVTAYNDVKRLAQRSKRAARISWQTFSQRYPDYDPDGVGMQLGERPASQPSPAETLLPAPFAWVKIPAGEVTLITEKGWPESYIPQGGSKTFTVKPFFLAKYPLTNAQYALFVQAGGYKTQQWWTETGWEARKQGWAWNVTQWEPTGNPWSEPRYWTNKTWNGAKQPVVGVSWYEAVAYCRWLSDKTGQQIMLPTEQQWQRAAQGDDGRKYPWGNEWDCKRCNNSVSPCDSEMTTPVTTYESRGDSPFGVVDMAGNVWEWCLTEYESGSHELGGTNVRVLRGGSWSYYGTVNFRVANRSRNDPSYWDFSGGFRLARSL